MNKTLLVFSALTIIFLISGFSKVSGQELSFVEKLELVVGLDKILGHLWAMEQNLENDDTTLIFAHAADPIEKLYQSISVHLADNPEIDTKLKSSLMKLQSLNDKTIMMKTQKTIDEAKEIIEEARIVIVGEEVNEDLTFKILLITMLLEASEIEYENSVSDGIIQDMVRFQAGSGFLWKSQEVYETIGENIDLDNDEDMQGVFADLREIYNATSYSSNITDSVSPEDDQFLETGIESEEENGTLDPFSVLSPLTQIKAGVAASDVVCKSGMELLLKSSNGKPACVSSSGAKKLVDWGWGQKV